MTADLNSRKKYYFVARDVVELNKKAVSTLAINR